jgi:histidine triad (HIT) family protein
VSTIFGKIASGEIAAEKLYEDEFVVAINDINPVAPVHILVIPKKPVRNLLALEDTLEDKLLAGAVLLACAKIARQLGLEESGCRVVLNAESDAGQTVFHLHAHLLGGRKLEGMG